MKTIKTYNYIKYSSDLKIGPNDKPEQIGDEPSVFFGNDSESENLDKKKRRWRNNKKVDLPMSKSVQLGVDLPDIGRDDKSQML